MERDSSMMVRSDARAQGMVTATNPRVRAPWSTLRDRCVGTDVKVTYADGSTETRPASSFRKRSIAAKAAVPRTSKLDNRGKYEDLLRRFGDHSELAGGDA